MDKVQKSPWMKNIVDIETTLLECYTKNTVIFWRFYYAQN